MKKGEDELVAEELEEARLNLMAEENKYHNDFDEEKNPDGEDILDEENYYGNYKNEEENNDISEETEGGFGSDKYYIEHWLNNISKISDLSELNDKDKELIEKLLNITK